MLLVELRAALKREEELGGIRVLARVCHRNDTSGMFTRKASLFVRKLLTKDALSTSTISIDDVTALAHESSDDSVEGRPFVPQRALPIGFGSSLLSSTENCEVLSCFGCVGGV